MALLWGAFLEALGLIGSANDELLGIVMLSLAVSGIATLLAAVIGVPLGTLLATCHFPGRAVLVIAVDTGMALPPVLVGLTVMMLLWRTGPLGSLEILYTPAAMIIAQLVIAVPFAAALTRSAVASLDPDIAAALDLDGAGPFAKGLELVRAARGQVTVAVAAAFGRAISEVGASLMVGGNIRAQTRVMTTAIAQEAGRGEFAHALALGLVLLGIALLVNVVLAIVGSGDMNRIRSRR